MWSTCSASLNELNVIHIHVKVTFFLFVFNFSYLKSTVKLRVEHDINEFIGNKLVVRDYFKNHVIKPDFVLN